MYIKYFYNFNHLKDGQKECSLYLLANMSYEKQ